MPKRRASVQLIDGYLRHIFAIHLNDLYDSWRELYNVKEKERQARELGGKRQSIPTTFANHNEENLFQLPIR
jgi:hypothetical protein